MFGLKGWAAGWAMAVTALVAVTALTWAADGGPQTVHALSVEASAGAPCADAPLLDANTLAVFFAPLGAGEWGVEVEVVDAATFTVTVAGQKYEATIGENNVAVVKGPDETSAQLLARDISVCLGGVAYAREQPPGMWTAEGGYVPLVPVADEH
ncbi:hypothetical protein [uncultured Piscinibacter sp.]|uniref:hypothetical protein n=1 Tax=uncultured Piscinibacter sp. TaxID=1131835 RepID=UPI0026177F6E|nr:hypothetical protein [uncultured Piscinibacter sp.]